MPQKKYEFQTEAKRLLELMVNSVYSNKDIFLRELVSNSSDALDKLRLESIKNPDLSELTEDPHIRIEADKDKRAVAVSDNGIGMNRDEIVEFLGTIARSGSGEFATLLEKANKEGLSAQLIGQFGVGFYSCFMVADRVVLTTRKAGEEKAWIFESTGDGTFTVTQGSRDSHGTTVTVYLKPDDKENELDYSEFASEYKIRSIIKQYADFVSYPIKMRTERTEPVLDDEGKPVEGAEPKTKVEDETLNSMKAIWTRPEDEVEESDYNEFYKHISHDWTDPLKRISYHAEGTSEFRALLFLPSRAPFDLNWRDSEHGIDLYVRRVFIMKDCEQLIPEYMRFVRGVVDSEDLSLNISREILQKDRRIKVIHNALVSKLLSTFKDMLEDEREDYEKFWTEFGKTLKEGIYSDLRNREKLLGVCLFRSTENGLVSLQQYIDRMKEDQKHIYYITGKSHEAVANSPHLEALREKGYEVLLLTDPVDEIWTSQVPEFNGKKLRSAIRGDIEFDQKKADDQKKDSDKEEKAEEKEKPPVLDAIKGNLEEHVKEVRFSHRLTSSPACVVSDENELTPQLEQILRATGQEPPKVKRILEINPNHAIYKKLEKLHKSDSDDPRIAEYSELLFGQAVLAEGGQLPDPAAFSKKLSKLLENNL